LAVGYLEALSYIEDEDVDAEDQSETGVQLRELKINIPNNICVCASQIKDWDMVLKHANMVLEIDAGNTKALYRRSMAYMNMNVLDEAKADIT
jgi:hypothetical protein